MKLNCYEEVKQLTMDMVRIHSVVKKEGQESAMAQYIYDFYMRLPYFQQRPQQVKMVATQDDFMLRHSTYAYVKGTKGTSNQTLLMIGHIDTVGIEDYGVQKKYACEPDLIKEKLKEMGVNQRVLHDIDSGEYMFGRGSLDMKSGCAGQLIVMKYFSEHPEELNGNLLLISECDEEDNSKGMITMLDELVMLKKQQGFEYIGCINADYTTGSYPDDPNRYIYYGTVGKVLPTYVIFGKEAHVGQPFSAFDPNLMAAEITRELSLNTAYCDEAQGEVTLPPISLKQTDNKLDYTVQTAMRSMVYFNYFIHGQTVKQVLEKCKMAAEVSMSRVITLLNEQYHLYCSMAHLPHETLPWQTCVYTWEELYAELYAEHGESFAQDLYTFQKTLHETYPTMDLREYGMKVVEYAWTYKKNPAVAIVLFLGSVFFTNIEVTGKSTLERNLINAVQHAIDKVEPQSKRIIQTRKFYPYISDLSFLSLGANRDSIGCLNANMPSAPLKYQYDGSLISQIDVPVVNIGSYGYDGHMLTERVDMWHTFQNVPNLTYHTICDLLK